MNTLKYHKIQSVYKRDENGNFIVGEFSTLEIEFLADKMWIGTEKIDGTNIRIALSSYDPIYIFGRKENSEIPKHLDQRLTEMLPMFDPLKLFGGKVFPDDANVMLIGEGYGNKIQKVGKLYKPDGTDFSLFDINIMVGGYFVMWWMTLLLKLVYSQSPLFLKGHFMMPSRP